MNRFLVGCGMIGAPPATPLRVDPERVSAEGRTLKLMFLGGVCCWGTFRQQLRKVERVAKRHVDTSFAGVIELSQVL